ncbi:alpha/beta-hydrolase [Punctularia strigosozonata HHB-11173 SS5]|uniref:alpha/beta-hydrolase n=1 Tax=Punctularia strigosozonata (strain HHB-11173) TaxID=741275 RepID=UPI0004417268|nr:alpha/beta-hydrolase [Punctularia strigosozonata HHB-11173 SS5]EIN07771.1 alpha/beta-hydrolase [Punctularia strigosozonata HHB-11173 SS5]
MSSSPKTLTYLHVDGLDVKLDLYAPDATGSAPILIWFHGGALFCGSRDDDMFPAWLLDAAHKRGWIFVSADYRLLVPCTGHDEIADVRALSSFLASDAFRAALPAGLAPSGATLISGGSAGGYVAIQYALHASPKPEAVFNLFGMIDLLNDHYLHPHPEGLRFFGGFYASFPGLEQLLRAPPSSGSPVRAPTFVCADGREVLMLHGIQEGTIPDHLVGRPGFRKDRPLFPLLHARGLPPVITVHGTADTAVPLGDSENLKKILGEAGVRNELITVPDAEHVLFNKDDFSALASGTEEAYARAVEFLAGAL